MGAKYVEHPCTNCGAGLPVTSAAAKFIVCDYCGSRFGLDRSGEVVGGDRLAVLERQLAERALEDFRTLLEEEWQEEKYRYAIKYGEGGASRFPSREVAQMIAFGPVLVFVASVGVWALGGNSFLMLGTGIIAGLCVPKAISEWQLAKRYHEAVADHQMRLANLRVEDFWPGQDGQIEKIKPRPRKRSLGKLSALAQDIVTTR